LDNPKYQAALALAYFLLSILLGLLLRGFVLFQPRSGNQASLLPRSDEKSPPFGELFILK
jgi:hypothetical protein